MRVTVLSGGVGGARFLAGLVQCVDPGDVTALCNVGDDFEWHGLHVSPDIDSVVYTLAGIEGEQGWGVRGDTFRALDELEALGEERWFAIGDRDLATHVFRTALLREGATLAEATAALAAARGLRTALLPVTNDPHPTVVLTDDGPLAFQDYFVRRRAGVPTRGFEFPGELEARPAHGVLEAFAADLVVIAPSNPFVSVDPILRVRGVRDALAACTAPRVAVSPIVGGAAVKGPAADMLRALGHEVSAVAVARLYAGLIDVFVLDQADVALAADVARLGIRPAVADTMMTDGPRRAAVARAVVDAATRDVAR